MAQEVILVAPDTPSPKRETNKTRLGSMGKFLARVHDHRRETQNAAGGVDKPNSQDMELVLQQRKG